MNNRNILLYCEQILWGINNKKTLAFSYLDTIIYIYLLHNSFIMEKEWKLGSEENQPLLSNEDLADIYDSSYDCNTYPIVSVEEVERILEEIETAEKSPRIEMSSQEKIQACEAIVSAWNAALYRLNNPKDKS